MTQNSYICNYIGTHPNTWEEDFKELGILVNKEEPYAIFNYGIMCDFYNPLIQEARGIIIDVNKLEVVCWPFRKFGNHVEGYADEIDWSTARVQEKLDGSICKLWFDNYKNTWRFSTNSRITPDRLFSKLLKKASFFSKLNTEKLDTENTYIFELTSPENQIVVKNPFTKLYHIGTRSNKTGREFVKNIGIEQPKEYALSCLEDCLVAVSELNKNSKEVEHEGFVVVDENFNRVKIKCPEYLLIHHTLDKTMDKKFFIQLVTNYDNLSESFLEQYPQFKKVYKYYEWQYSEFLYEIEKIMNYARALYEEYSCDRKAVARTIKDLPFSFYGFKALNNNMTPEELVNQFNFDGLLNYVKEYEGEIPRIFKKSSDIVKEESKLNESEIEYE